MRRIVFDIEADNLLDKVKNVWCIGVVDADTGKEEMFTGDLTKAIELLRNAEEVIGHNIIGYDLPVLKKLYSLEIPLNKVKDTFILSQMLYPNDMVKHGLAEWGKRFGFPKGDFKDFSNPGQEMYDYCAQDVKITYRLYKQCEKELNVWDWSKPLALEQKVWDIYTKEQTHWYLDMKLLPDAIQKISEYAEKQKNYLLENQVHVMNKFESLETAEKNYLDGLPKHILLLKEKDLSPKNTLEEKLHTALYLKSSDKFTDLPIVNKYIQALYRKKHLANRVVTSKKTTRAMTLKGDISSIAKRYGEQCGMDIVGDFCKIRFEPFNLSSSKQVVEWLLGLGWEPETFSEKTGNPSISGDPFYGIPKYISEPLLEYKKATHKLGQIKGWDEKKDEEGRIEQFALTCGTNTARFRHSIIVNVPQASEHPVFGKIMRELFVAKEGYRLVGVDAAALEARIEGHYTTPYDNGAYADMLLNGDIHKVNADSWGLTDKFGDEGRKISKAPYFAMTYGAQPRKIAAMLGITLSEAQYMFTKYWEDRPAVVALLDALHQSIVSRGQGAQSRGRFTLKEYSRPWIKGIDGRKLYIRSSHSIKNTLIQSAGSIAMKVAYCKIYDEMQRAGIDGRIVMFYHDEYAIMGKDDGKTPQKILSIAKEAIAYAGKYLKLTVPLVGEGGIGENWHEVH